MREIKFRQPVFDNGAFLKFHYWGFVRDGEFKGIISPIDEAKNTSQQFTGLRDKNGKEIYAGDILCWPQYEGTEHQWRWNIEWSDNQACFTSWHPRDKAEVIGNIYENPELLPGD